ncbi:glycoside hydrolase family 43 protein [Pedobacter duraquae]|uniref:Arabinoxylan arabinofuranohydrolase n=1 Tax=Pedobacter duraquae TaxID=425511 RepID=A0A4R6IRM2_9SPHI|nr:glycoside hydrolase family 43 protein [Pedobacter duraquae]TDO24606.1 arabinoxylan arabinofuranohydrolase [Pedobacter duraquae]
MNKRFSFTICLLTLLICSAKLIYADQVIVGYRHLADPGTLVYNGRVYLYASNDDDNTMEKNSGYKMKSIVCVSSSDMKNWTDHGVVFEAPRDVDWAGRTWAPAAVARDGKIFLYFGNGGNGIGVATSSSPTAPFKDPIGKKLVETQTPGVLPAPNMWLFDPMTFVDDDGQAYMYFGGNGDNNVRVIKLNRDMISVDGPATSITAPAFFEASWMHKRNGIYYFSYSTNPRAQMRIDYMMSKSPTTGFTYGGVVAAQPPNNNNNNHQGIFEFNGKWYHTYHNRVIAYQSKIPTEFKRNLAIENLEYNADGTIQQVAYTADGVAQVGGLDPYVRVEAETMSAQQGVKTESSTNGGLAVTGIKNGDWIKIQGVDFKKNGAKKFTIAAINAGKETNLELRLGSVEGKLLATVSIPASGDQQRWKELSCKVNGATGQQDLFIVVKGAADPGLKLDWWKFSH